MSFGATWTDYSTVGFNTDPKTFEFSSWDAGKTRGCVCDATFGDVDCSKRMCPFGNDILDVSDDLDDYQHNVQQLAFVSNYYNGTGDLTDLNTETFALTFTSKLNETFTTIPIVFDGSSDTDMRNDIQLALLSLPNRVIDGVSVSISRTDTKTLYGSAAAKFSDFSTTGPSPGYGLLDNVLLVKITFTGSAVQGRQNYLQVEDYECNDGCTPKLSGLSLQYKYDHFVSNITDVYESTTASDGGFMNVADFNSYECGRRGKCDYNTGLCQCFAGYFGDNCNTLTTLV
jgi:hypothetical protein